MKKCMFLGFSIILLFCFSMIINTDESKSYYTQNELLEDFDNLYETILKEHPQIFTNKKELENLKNIQRNKIKDMSKYEFIKLVSPLIAKINCGHSTIDLNFEKDDKIINEANFLPIQVKVIDNKIYLIKDYTENTITPGSEIHAINNKKSENIIKEFYNSIPSDGEINSIKEIILNTGIRFNYLYYFFIDNSKQYNINYSLPGESSKLQINLNSNNYEKLIKNYESSPFKNEPNINVKYEINDKYALLSIPHFIYYEEEEKKEFDNIIDSFFLELKETNVNKLILDLRGNDGGDPFAGNKLLSYLLSKPFKYFSDETPYYTELKKQSEINSNSFKGELYTLIDGGSFSTTGHVISLLQDQNRGKFIGNESGAGFICSDYSQDKTLSNSGIKFRLATLTFSTNVKGQQLGRGIIPDVHIKYSISDYLEKRDLEIDYIVSHINK